MPLRQRLITYALEAVVIAGHTAVTVVLLTYVVIYYLSFVLRANIVHYLCKTSCSYCKSKLPVHIVSLSYQLQTTIIKLTST